MSGTRDRQSASYGYPTDRIRPLRLIPSDVDPEPILEFSPNTDLQTEHRTGHSRQLSESRSLLQSPGRKLFEYSTTTRLKIRDVDPQDVSSHIS
jgi:hypothetical protein